MKIDRRASGRLAAGLLAAALLPAARAKPPEGKGKPDKGQSGSGGGDSLVTVTITSQQARQYALAGNATGYKSLPPGIRKNLARGKPLPPGNAKKVAPPAVLRELPQYPGYEWQAVGTDLVLVAVATAIVASVLVDVFR